MALLLAAVSAWADTLTGAVVRIDDGDSLEVRDAAGQRHRVRLRGIDAPERAQPHSKVARRNLSRLTRGRPVTVSYDGVDKYGRLLAWVYVDDGASINLLQVRAGLAWHYAFPGNPWTVDDHLLARAEREARTARLGLWSRSNPLPPWQYRKNHRDEPWRAAK
jgi:endonuclease YncB( thermonuclease family)